MWALVVLFSMVAAMGALMVSQEAKTAPAALASDDHLVRNMAVYRSMVVEHVLSHATPAGHVSDDVLPFPSWYLRHPAWRNVVLADGTIVVYAQDNVPSSLVTRLVQLSQGSMLAGQARQRPSGETYLHSPSHGDTGIALPALDEGSVVWLARKD